MQFLHCSANYQAGYVPWYLRYSTSQRKPGTTTLIQSQVSFLCTQYFCAFDSFFSLLSSTNNNQLHKCTFRKELLKLENKKKQKKQCKLLIWGMKTKQKCTLVGNIVFRMSSYWKHSCDVMCIHYTWQFLSELYTLMFMLHFSICSTLTSKCLI